MKYIGTYIAQLLHIALGKRSLQIVLYDLV